MTPLDNRDLAQIERTVRNLCAKRGIPQQDRDDVVQDTFLILLEQDMPVTRAAATAMRRTCPREPERLQYVDPHHLDTRASDEPGPDEQAEVHEALEGLDPEDEKLLRWRREGWTLKEIARKLGMSYEMVTKRIVWARCFVEEKSTGKGR